jgi:predicted O-methyltransferase YrrM
MATDRWYDVDDYLAALLSPDDAALAGALDAARAAGLPPISVAPPQGKFLHLIARIAGARRILEIGTLGGYSTIWLARALPADGSLTTLEIDPKHAAVARSSLISAGLGERVDLRVGAALDTLPILQAEGAGPYDLVFIDADKQNNAQYVRWALTLTHPGSVIVVDNVIREGTVADAASTDPSVLGAREVLQLIADEPKLDGTALQTVGSKGWDGFAIALVTS